MANINGQRVSDTGFRNGGWGGEGGGNEHREHICKGETKSLLGGQKACRDFNLLRCILTQSVISYNGVLSYSEAKDKS